MKIIEGQLGVLALGGLNYSFVYN